MLFNVLLTLMLQLGRNFAQVTTAELSWQVQNYDLFTTLFFK